MHEFLAEVLARTPEESGGPDVYAGSLTKGQLEELAKWAEET